MKKLVALFTLLACFNASAGIIEVTASDNIVDVGDTLGVTVTGSGFNSVNSLSFLFDFDTTAFSFDALSLSNPDGSILLGALPFPTNVSFGYLFVPFSVTDFIVEFDLAVIGLGDGNLSVSNVLAGFQGLGLPTVEPVTVTGTDVAFASSVPTPVSAPATLGLFALLGSLVFLRRRK